MQMRLLRYDEGSALQQISVIENRLIPAINEFVVPTFDDLGLGNLTKLRFDDLFQNGGGQIYEEYIKDARLQLSKAGINVKKVKERLLNEYAEVFENLLAIVEKFKNENQMSLSLLKYVDFTKGKAVLTADNSKMIKEDNSTYVQTENGLKLQMLHEKAALSVNEFLAALQEFCPLPLVHPLTGLFKLTDGSPAIAGAAFMDYDKLTALRDGIKESDKFKRNREKELKQQFSEA
jgi:hypothetical protein